MNKKTIITALLALVASGAWGFTYRIVGNVGTDFTGWLYVQNQSDDEPETVDSLWVENGEIQTRDMRAHHPFMALLYSRNRNIPLQYFPLFAEEGTIRMVEAPMTMRSGAFYGTPLNDEWKAYYHCCDTLGRLFDEGRITRDEAFRRLDSISEPLVHRHHSDLLGAYVASTMEELGTGRLLEYVKMLSAEMQSNRIVCNTVAPRLTARRTAEGQPFVDFEAEYQGRIQCLSDYVGRGQYVLVDFWASWCGPCREEIPNLIAAYEKYKGKGLVVLGVAAWDKPENTEKAIRDLDIAYPQILNTQSVATDLYGISGIPHIILFAPDGTIIARGLRGEEIDAKLAEIFYDK